VLLHPLKLAKCFTVTYRAFIVEDDQLLYDSLAEYLPQAAKVQLVGHAAGESDARAFLAEHPAAWDVAIVDLFLTEGSGLGVLDACRSREPGQQVVVLTSYATSQMRARCKELGAAAVFDKSTQLPDLVAFCRQQGPGVSPPTTARA
jgi:two-component system OmpR family response regulator